MNDRVASSSGAALAASLKEMGIISMRFLRGGNGSANLFLMKAMSFTRYDELVGNSAIFWRDHVIFYPRLRYLHNEVKVLV